MTQSGKDESVTQLHDILDWTLLIGDVKEDRAVVCLEIAADIQRIKKDELSRLPFHLNILETFTDGKLRETAHSRFLWKLLRLPVMMDSFMNQFFGGSLSFHSWKVNYPDQFRIDISIESPTDFFIIENKINDAQEQCGQIYRYVQHALRAYRATNIHVLYLNSKTHDSPSPYSLSKDGKGVTFIPDGINLRVISYKDEITDWMETLYPNIPDREPYLKSAIFQYTDYLKEFFNTSTRYNDMNHKIDSMVKSRLFTEEMSTVEKLNTISDVKKQLDDLKSQLEKIEQKQEAVRFQEWFEDLISLYPLDEYNWKRDNDTDIHLEFRFKGFKLEVFLAIDHGLCWGVRCLNKNLPNKWVKELHDEVQVYLPKVRTSEWWPVWDFTSYENGLTRFKTLLECVFSLEDDK